MEEILSVFHDGRFAELGLAGVRESDNGAAKSAEALFVFDPTLSLLGEIDRGKYESAPKAACLPPSVV